MAFFRICLFPFVGPADRANEKFEIIAGFIFPVFEFFGVSVFIEKARFPGLLIKFFRQFFWGLIVKLAEKSFDRVIGRGAVEFVFGGRFGRVQVVRVSVCFFATFFAVLCVFPLVF